MDKNNIVWEESELRNIRGFAINNELPCDHIHQFTNFLIKNASARTNIEYKEIVDYNVDFFQYLERLSKREKRILIFSDEFENFCSMFKIPVIKNNLRGENSMSIGEVREKREEELLNYPKDSEKLLSNSDNLHEKEKSDLEPEASIYTHRDCLKIFDKLNSEEKIKFIKAFQKVQIVMSPEEIIKLL